MTTFFTDFSTYSNGALQTTGTADWALNRLQGDWSCLVQTDAGATGGKSALFDDNAWGFDGIQSFYNKSITATTGALEVLVRVKWSVALSSLDFPVGPALLSSTDTDTGYGICYKGGGAWGIKRIVDGDTDVTVGSLSGNILTPALGTYYYVRLGITAANVVKANLWAGSAGSEPAGFNVAGGTDTTITAALRPGIFGADGNYSQTYDTFGSSDGGDTTAPSGTAAAGSNFLINTRRGSGGVQDMSRGM